MRYRLELAAEDEDYSVLEYDSYEGGYRIIDTETNTIVGYLWCDFSCDFSDGRTSHYIHMIEIIEKGKGTGTRFIRELFYLLDTDALEGMVLSNGYMNAYNFWNRLGADLSLGEDSEGSTYDKSDVEKLVNEGCRVSFWLER